MDIHYKTSVTILKDAIVKMWSWGSIAGTDIDAIVKTVIDVNCTAWKKAMQGIKTGNSKTLMKIEEKKEGVIRVIEDRDIPMKDDMTVVDADKIESKSEEEKEIKIIIIIIIVYFRYVYNIPVFFIIFRLFIHVSEKG